MTCSKCYHFLPASVAFDLGLERTGGFKTVAFCEIDKKAQAVLRKHWPEVPCYEDVATLTGERLARDGVAVDVICGGFPCQDISLAGLGAGLAGERSGLWSEIARLVGELQPRYVIVENVSALLGRGLGDVLGDLAALRYDAEWHCIPASAVGAPHRRDRIWIVAYPGSERREGVSAGRGPGTQDGDVEGCQAGGVSTPPVFTNAICWQLAQRRQAGRVGRQEPFSRDGHWPLTSEPFLRRGSHGLSGRSHRLKALGNAVVPQIPELIGRAILAAEAA